MDSGAVGGGVTAIRVPYRHLRDAEMELVSLNGSPRAGEGPPKDPARNGDGAHQAGSGGTSRTKLVLACTVAAGVQFGWALQLSLLTPYIQASMRRAHPSGHVLMSHINAGIVIKAVTTTWIVDYIVFSAPTSNFGYVFTCCSFLIFVQTLGIDHAMASFIWLCGPITGFVVQPCVGVWSDKCRSKYGRRRPFILAGCLMICAAVNLGYILGDTAEHCRTYKGSRYRAAIVFILGFWMLDLANNTVQGPARALLADLSGPDQCNSANAIFCSWMAVGNILGFSAGASGNWHKWFPFLTTRACCEACGNLKAAFLIAVVFLLFCMSVTLYFAEEIPLEPKDAQGLSDSAPLLNGSRDDGHASDEPNNERLTNGHVDGNNVSANSNSEEFTRDSGEVLNDGPGAVLVNILTSMRHLPPGMHSVLLVMALTWLSWFPFFLFDTDWMGREVYHGDPNGDLSERKAYDNGVREGAFGLLLNSVVLGIGSFLVDPLCRMVGARLVWAISNFTVFICMMATTILSWISSDLYSSKLHHIIGANKTVKYSALIVFSLLGLPLSITYSVPFSITAELTAGTGGGQGLATGVLNLAIVVPQIVVSLGAGPWDALYGGGNIPAFALASIFSLGAGALAILKLPKLSNSYQSAGFHGFG
ncbi:Sucrose transport protein SUT4 [Dichanthelium oligosanthes]|uniref:Sucrose transport protein SUT4 n=1 Tax=Dichanthelium oligosanthes TaxID=888268 RepID=A0A1E5URD9_9POAL|nr:Sucrose transport protein SUT4 [Dichanthelium oligosanthes]